MSHHWDAQGIEEIGGPAVEVSKPESSFFVLLDRENKYQEYGPVEVRICECDGDYPVELSALSINGDTIGVSLTRETIKRIIAEAWIAGVQLY